jgi:hypothetical protein
MACRMFDEEYVEWENATTKCQELGARLPVLSDADTIKIVKKYLETAEFEVFEVRILITGGRARLSVLSDADTIKIVKKYLETAEFEVFEVRILKKEHEAKVSPLRNRRHDDCQASGPSSRSGRFGMYKAGQQSDLR